MRLLMNILIVRITAVLVTLSSRNSITASSTNPLHFLVIGDWGKGGVSGYTWNSVNSGKKRMFRNKDNADRIANKVNSNANNGNNNNGNNKKQATNQAAVAAAMAKYASSSTTNPPKFIVSTGDNFYTKGVQSSTDTYWDYLWTNVYHVYDSLSSLPWFPVVGNHDWGYGYSGIQAQIDRFKNNPDGLWQMPSTNYSRSVVIDESGATMLMLFIDTTTLAPSMNKCCNSNGGISAEIQTARVINQLHRLDAALSSATLSENPPTWIVVVGHYPVFSIGTNSGDVAELVSYLLPILIKYNVDVYLCGHDHISAHLKYSGIDFFVVGAGSMTDSTAGQSAAEAVWASGSYGAFAAIEVSVASMKVSYHNTSNDCVHSVTRQARLPPAHPIDEPTLAPTNNSTDDANINIDDDGSVYEDDESDGQRPIFDSAATVGVVSGAISLGVLMALLVFRVRIKKRRSNSKQILDKFDSNPHLGSQESSSTWRGRKVRKEYSPIELTFTDAEIGNNFTASSANNSSDVPLIKPFDQINDTPTTGSISSFTTDGAVANCNHSSTHKGDYLPRTNTIFEKGIGMVSLPSRSGGHRKAYSNPDREIWAIDDDAQSIKSENAISCPERKLCSADGFRGSSHIKEAVATVAPLMTGKLPSSVIVKTIDRGIKAIGTIKVCDSFSEGLL